MTAADGVWFVAGLALYATPHVLEINHGAPVCAPCERGTVPWFDRWAIAEPRDVWAHGSDVLVVGLGALAVWDLLDGGSGARADVVALAQSAGMALGLTELIKAVVARHRPVLYTAQAVEAAASLDAQRSWPSGHTAAAFALATSLAMSRRGRDGGAGWRRWAAWVAAAGVGMLRVAGARHFPSDVVGGAAVGMLSAVAVHEIRF